MSLHETQPDGRKRSLSRRAAEVVFQDRLGLAAVVEGGKTVVVDVTDGKTLAEFPGTQIGLIATDRDRKHVARYLPGRLAVKSGDRMRDQIVTQGGKAVGLEIDSAGRCAILNASRLHLVDEGRNLGTAQFDEHYDSPFLRNAISSRIVWPETSARSALGLELIGMSKNNGAFLVSTETGNQLARVDNDFVRYRVRRYKDLFVFRFGDESRRAGSTSRLHWFRGANFDFNESIASCS